MRSPDQRARSPQPRSYTPLGARARRAAIGRCRLLLTELRGTIRPMPYWALPYVGQLIQFSLVVVAEWKDRSTPKGWVVMVLSAILALVLGTSTIGSGTRPIRPRRH